MSYPVIISMQAQRELIEITLWYNEKSAFLGVDFTKEYSSVLNYLEQFPESFTMINKKRKVRQVMMKRFPYLVLFVFHPTHIVVTRIVHAHRHPAERTRKK